MSRGCWMSHSKLTSGVFLVLIGAASEPKLSVVSVETGAVTLQCEATCWLPQPEVMFLDNQGNNISAEDPKRDENNGRCFTVRRRVTLQTPTNRFKPFYSSVIWSPSNNKHIIVYWSCLSYTNTHVPADFGYKNDPVFIVTIYCNYAICKQKILFKLESIAVILQQLLFH